MSAVEREQKLVVEEIVYQLSLRDKEIETLQSQIHQLTEALEEAIVTLESGHFDMPSEDRGQCLDNSCACAGKRIYEATTRLRAVKETKP